MSPQPQHVVPPVTPQPRERRPEPVAAPAVEASTAVASMTEHVVAAPQASNAAPAVAAKPKPSLAAPSPLARVETPVVASPGAAVLTATAASEAIPVSSAPLAAPPAPAPAAAVPAPEMPQPIGPFFEMAQVDKAPRVASRVEPVVPSGAPSKVNKDIALVRVLVSQAGHPVLVRLLRPSKGGLAYDDAVIAAVKKWTFTPAVKRGETVTCWLHVAVPLSGGQ